MISHIRNSFQLLETQSIRDSIVMSIQDLENIRKELWVGEVAVCFTLDAADLASILIEPEPCSAMIPRSSYLPLHMADIKQYFSAFIRQELLDNEIWCDTEHGDKIKWHLPFGVSYDILHGLSVEGAIWHLNVHFSDYPEQELLRCPSLDCVKSYFLTTLKEADALKHGSAVMSNIREKENSMLWNGILTKSYDEFWTINRKLMDCNSKRQPLTYRNLPVRLYNIDRTYTQPLLPAPSEESSCSIVTVDDLLYALSIKLDDDTIVITQGIKISLDSPLFDLSQTLSYPDNFLYLCVVKA